MDFLKNVVPAHPDAIFGINLAFAADDRKNKLNASVGTYRDENLAPYILPSVKLAEQQLIGDEKSKEYLPIQGELHYLDETAKLLFGDADTSMISRVQAVGGTGALYLSGALLKHIEVNRLYISKPTWGNHLQIFKGLGLDVHQFPHTVVLPDEILPRSALLLQACCHNPTGEDPSHEQWQAILDVVREKELFVIFDCAYQGFGDGLDEDAYAMRLFQAAKVPFCVTVSHSKNFGLYGERTGALLTNCKDKEEAGVLNSRLKAFIRAIYSNCPCHGARIVSTILTSIELKQQWLEEVEAMRKRILDIRNELATKLDLCFAKNKQNYKEIRSQKGMFAFPGLTKDHVALLKEKHGIYLTGDGRINLAGLNKSAVETLTAALQAIENNACADGP